jgi:hypothetical protein
MSMKPRSLFFIAAVAMVAFYAPRSGTCEDRLIWYAKGTIDSITSHTLRINRFDYKLTSATAYEMDNHQTTLSAFEVGDHVKVTFLTDRSALKVEGESSNEQAPSRTPTPAATPKVTKLSARLAPLGTSKAKGESVGTYSSTQSKFILLIKIPRNSIPLATTEVEAKALSVRATITRDGDLVARCTTAFAAKRAKRSVFEYKTEIERRSSAGSKRTRARKGRCVLANGSTGLPSVRPGDLVTISETAAGEFLRGDF